MLHSILILHSDVPPDAPEDEQDTLIQAQEISACLKEIGYEVQLLPFTSNLQHTLSFLKKNQPDLIFNLVETLEGDGQLIHVAPAILEHLRLPYTGCSKDAIYTTSNKILAKKIMRSQHIPTPGWIELSGSHSFTPGRYILKAVWEHASVGLDQNSVPDIQHLDQGIDYIRQKSALQGKTFFAEQYVHGREFNIAILAGKVLPIPEICFINHSDSALKIVDYKAKWDQNSPEYQNTLRKFSLDPADQDLYQAMAKIALQCWDVFALTGYARVDFRVDQENNPFVLEINANPCIAKDAGFFAACSQAGITYQAMIKLILNDLAK